MAWINCKQRWPVDVMGALEIDESTLFPITQSGEKGVGVRMTAAGCWLVLAVERLINQDQ